MNQGYTSEIYNNTEITIDEEMHMEVKSEPDIDLEMYHSGESMSFSADNDSGMQLTESQSDRELEELEDEPLVEIESIAVPQQVVEVDLQPSLILFVNAEPNTKSKKRSKTSIVDSENALNTLKETSSSGISEEEIAIRKSITRALRNVKIKQNKAKLKSLPRSCKTDILENKNSEILEGNESNLDEPSSPFTSCGADEELPSTQPHKWKSISNSKHTLVRPKVKQVFDKTKKKRHKEMENKSEDNKALLTKRNTVFKRNFKSKKVKVHTSKGKENSKNKNMEVTETIFNNSDSIVSKSIDIKNSEPRKKVGRSKNKERKKVIKIKLVKPVSYNCEVCGKEFKNLGGLAVHSNIHLMKPESFDCTVCGKKFKEKSHLATHSRAHVEIRNYKCNECGSLFKTKTNLYFHMKTHEEAPFICEKCNKIFAERKMLMRHIRVVHSGEGSYNCDQCGRSFKSGHNLELHYTLHTGNKPFTCLVCEKSFVYKSTYTAHTKAHQADDQFNCELCPSDILDKAEMRRRCNHHSSARPWLCTVCGKGYPLKSTLKHHMKTHEPEKPFKCNECEKSFMKKSSYECHLKSHSGENPPYMCDQCSQSYYNVFALKRHYLKHTSERRFVCDICNKAFWMKDALKVHKRSHANIKMFKCTQCSKSFVHKHTLVAHMRTHSGESSFSCLTCPKTFSHKYNLDRHQRQHSMPTMPPPPLPPSFMMMGPPKHLELPTLHVL